MRPQYFWMAVLCALGSMPANAAAALTFTKDVAPIFYSKCVSCHRPGEVAPMSLLSYETARPWTRSIKAKVTSRQMPPWFVDGEPGRWRNDLRLTENQIATIAAWVDGGALKGDPADLPPPPQFAEGWNHPTGRPPDVVIEPPEVSVPAEGQFPWQTVYVKPPFFDREVWVEAWQVLPGNRSVVHHVSVTAPQLSSGSSIDAKGRLVETTGVRGATFSAPSTGVKFNASWEPGNSNAVTFPPGTAYRLSPGHYFSFNIHYQVNGTSQRDRTRIGLWLAKGPVTRELAGHSFNSKVGWVFIAEGQELTGRYSGTITAEDKALGDKSPVKAPPVIPAFAENWHLTQIIPILDTLTVEYFLPHMHLRGKSIAFTAIYPDGREETLLNEPKYDFNWQMIYELARPVTLLPGTVVRVDVTFDNSNKNKFNPAPDRDVFWGEQSWDEMLTPDFTASVALKPTERPSQHQ